MTKVLDASVLIAKLRGEPGGEQVALSGNVMSLVNLSEVATYFVRIGVDATDLVSDLDALGLRLEPLRAKDVQVAAQLYPVTKEKGLSLGDRVCLATAKRLNLPALTADRTWAELDLDLDVQLLR